MPPVPSPASWSRHSNGWNFWGRLRGRRIRLGQARIEGARFWLGPQAVQFLFDSLGGAVDLEEVRASRTVEIDVDDPPAFHPLGLLLDGRADRLLVGARHINQRVLSLGRLAGDQLDLASFRFRLADPAGDVFLEPTPLAAEVENDKLAGGFVAFLGGDFVFDQPHLRLWLFFLPAFRDRNLELARLGGLGGGGLVVRVGLDRHPGEKQRAKQGKRGEQSAAHRGESWG
jgi:hypothetical protein